MTIPIKNQICLKKESNEDSSKDNILNIKNAPISTIINIKNLTIFLLFSEIVTGIMKKPKKIHPKGSLKNIEITKVVINDMKKYFFPHIWFTIINGRKEKNEIATPIIGINICKENKITASTERIAQNVIFFCIKVLLIKNCGKIKYVTQKIKNF